MSAALAVASVALAACSSPSGFPAPTTTASSSAPMSASPSGDASAAVTDAALTAYRGYWAAQVTAQADPSAPVPQTLRTYAIDRALTDEQAALLLYRQQGIEFRGEPVLSPQVTSVSQEDPPKVVISDCVDSANWVPVYAATGKPAGAPGQASRVLVEAVATTYAGRWVIRSSTVLRGRTC